MPFSFPSAPRNTSFLIALTCILAFGAGAYAQQPGGKEAPLQHMGHNADEPHDSAQSPTPPTEDEIGAHNMARQEVREEMQKIRDEHENLEAQHDQLKTQCMNSKGQDRTDCQQKWQTLREQREALHGRIMALREKMDAARAEHRSPGNPDRRDEHHAMNRPNAAPAMQDAHPAGSPPSQLPPNDGR